MKRLALITLSLISVFALMACGSDEEVVAKVNDEAITEAEWQTNVDMMKQQYQQQYAQFGQEIDFESEEGEEILEMIEEQALESLIQQEVLVQKAEEAGYETPEADIDEEMDAMAEQYGSEEEFDQILEDNNFSRESYRELLEDQFTIDAYINDEVSIEVSDDEIDEFYEDYVSQFEDQEEEPEDKEDIEDMIIEQIEQEKQQEAVQDIIDDAKETYDIERFI